MNDVLIWLSELWTELADFFRTNYDPIWDTLDIALVVVAVYWVISLLRGTRAVQVAAGFLALIALRLVAELGQLTTTLWILDAFLGYGVFIIIVLFAPEIRRALARVGRGVFLGKAAEEELQHLEEVVRAAADMGERRTGALIVIERETRLEDLVEVGVALDATLTRELLTSIFQPSSPLHDGAVILQGGRVAYAGCILPLTLRTDLAQDLGTRHRAAVGLTEETDAVAVVVSEERGNFAVAAGGEIVRGLDAPRLRERLRESLTRERGTSSESTDDAASPDAASLKKPVATADVSAPGAHSGR